MNRSSKHLLIILFLFLSWTKSLSSASKEVSSVIHPFVRVLDGQQCLTTTVDGAGTTTNVGQYTSLQLNTSGNAVISYSDVTNTNLMLAVCNNAACSNPTITKVDGTNTNVGQYTSLQLNTSGNAVISYRDVTNTNLMLAVCNDAACSSPTITTVDGTTNKDVGQYTSLQLNTSGNAVISYRDATNTNLMLAVCNDAACSSPTITKVDGTDTSVGEYMSLQLNTSGNAVISYYDATHTNLMLAVCNDAACSSPTITTVDSTSGTIVGFYTSLQLNTSGNAVISYYDGQNTNLMLAICNDAACSSPTITKVDGTNTAVGLFTSLQLNTSGNAVISYWDGTLSNLMLAVCNDAACSSPTITTVDSSNKDVGKYNSLQLNTIENAVISYYDGQNTNLMLASCTIATISAISAPSGMPSLHPSAIPSKQPSHQPSHQPSSSPSDMPSLWPSHQPSLHPSAIPSKQPSHQPSHQPSSSASGMPSLRPSHQPSLHPSAIPSKQPSHQPSHQPSSSASGMPSLRPSHQPSLHPSAIPSKQPSHQPSHQPSSSASGMPSLRPSHQPSLHPSAILSKQPSHQPSHQPSSSPSGMPSLRPSHQPSLHPSAIPSKQPSHHPSHHPSSSPSGMPSLRPSHQPNLYPSHQPSKSKDKRKKTKAKKKKAKKPTTPKVGKKVKKSRKKANK